MRAQLPDFDTLRTMANQDPEGLERLRTRLVDELIGNAAPEHRSRLQGLQFQVDMERRRAANPMAACIKISSMMRDSLLRLQQAINEPGQTRTAPTNARVLRFNAPLATPAAGTSTRR